MFKAFVLLLILFLDKDSTEVIVDKVDIIEMNYVHDDNRIKYGQVIFWEYKPELLLPEKDEVGKRTGFWYKASGFVVIEYRVFYGIAIQDNLQGYLFPRKRGDKWISNFYDDRDRCWREIHSKELRVTHTRHDPEIENKNIYDTLLRRKLKVPSIKIK